MIRPVALSVSHPEFVSGSIVQPSSAPSCARGVAVRPSPAWPERAARWMLKRVQYDGVGVDLLLARPSPVGRGWGGGSAPVSMFGLSALLPHPQPLPAGEGSQQ